MYGVRRLYYTNNKKRITSIVIIVKYGAQEARNRMDTVISILIVFSVLLAIGFEALLPPCCPV